VILPVVGILSWLIWGPFRRIHFNVIVGSFLSMLIYGIYIFIRGYFTHQYPYPFINVVNVGYVKALYSAGLVFILFFCLAFLLWGIDCFRRRIWNCIFM